MLPPSEKETLIKGAQALKVELSPKDVDHLLLYLDEIRRWNSKIKLVAPGSRSEQIILHLIDSLTPLPFLTANYQRVVDLGSGAGLPGVVLQILRPQWRLALVEAREKKVAFLKHIKRLLHLENLSVHKQRLEASNGPISENQVLDGQADLVVFRALGSFDQILPLARQLVVPRGTILAYKGPKAEEEISNSIKLLDNLNMRLDRHLKISLPFLDHKRSLLFFKVD